MTKEKTIWTIGHSTRTIEEFITLLQSFEINLLVDVRNFPGSRKFPHFNKDALQQVLIEKGIQYLHIKDLGGRRKPAMNSVNTRWRLDAFRGYADYMQTDTFKQAAEELEQLASVHRVVYMCSEAVWWSCHRSLISDWLKVRDWKVLHIMKPKKAEEHPYTKAARIVNNELRYDEPELF